jgi:hypothetical protein
MKMLIDIQEETYNKIRRGEALYPADANVAIFAIETGTPIEEGKDEVIDTLTELQHEIEKNVLPDDPNTCLTLIQQKINKRSEVECSYCGCHNSKEALKCWWCHHTLKRR